MDEDLIGLRRSLALAPSLPADQAAKLLDEVEHLRRTRRDLASDLDQLAEQVERLRRRLSRRPGSAGG